MQSARIPVSHALPLQLNVFDAHQNQKECTLLPTTHANAWEASTMMGPQLLVQVLFS
jgi:hypothetical protein